MSGNVWEWVNDFYEERYFDSAPEENPHGPERGIAHILRGGLNMVVRPCSDICSVPICSTA